MLEFLRLVGWPILVGIHVLVYLDRVLQEVKLVVLNVCISGSERAVCQVLTSSILNVRVLCVFADRMNHDPKSFPSIEIRTSNPLAEANSNRLFRPTSITMSSSGDACI